MTILTLAVLLMGADEARYAKPDLLIDAGTLMKAPAGRYLVIDVRLPKTAAKGHIPGALGIDVRAWGDAFAKGESAEAWSRRLAAAGIDPDRSIVVYGDPKTSDVARVWWTLRYWGVKDVRILDGGWPAWQKAGGKSEAGFPEPARTRVTLAADAARLATKEEILRGLKTKGFDQIIDARTPGEFCGDMKLAKRGGSIPGAKNLNWTDTLDADGRFHPPAKMAKLLKDAGIDPARPAVTYCQGGGRAAVLAFVVELMGGKPARNYYKSWGEWGNDETAPVESHKKK